VSQCRFSIGRNAVTSRRLNTASFLYDIYDSNENRETISKNETPIWRNKKLSQSSEISAAPYCSGCRTTTAESIADFARRYDCDNNNIIGIVFINNIVSTFSLTSAQKAFYKRTKLAMFTGFTIKNLFWDIILQYRLLSKD